MTYINLINFAKNKYKNYSNVVNFELLFFCSETVKNKTLFVINRNKEIDFSKKNFLLLLKRYYVDKEPLGTILGFINFLNVKIKINKNVLVPRTETELITEKSIKLIKKYKISSVYDLCCGSGNIGICIKKNINNTNVTCVDINKDAIACTKINSKINNVQVKTICGDFYKSIKKKIPCIVCNPPYVDINYIDKNMTKYETKISFNNSKDNLFFYKKIIENINKIMTKKFLIIFEIGYDQKTKLKKILEKNNLSNFSKFYKDYSHNDRMLVINRQ
ncbi:MAG: peptide chain release factor N(5)-glutamine methyltransferase [Mycoplasmataceae bacterium]|jgi:release factor glutamine methyltransferase|nr:peptide chain release factor N(5)-glutamine methyltransferase [Mycoplasmataceae bacterium]